MNRFLKHWHLSGCGEAFRAHVVSYADDFVILSRGRAAEALTWTKGVMTKLGLTLNEELQVCLGEIPLRLKMRKAHSTDVTSWKRISQMRVPPTGLWNCWAAN